MNFCSTCGSDQLEFRIPEGDSFERFICGSCETIHYTNPNVVVGCLALYEDKVLLAKRAISPRKGYWNIPAGFLENKETVVEGALREMWEEALARPEIVRLHCVYDLPSSHQLYLHFLGRLTEPEFGVGVESLEVRLFSEDEIPWDEIAFSSSRFALKKFFEFGWDVEKVHQGSRPANKPPLIDENPAS